ncbi:hypothetical protein PYCCODRAFT_1430803 [Trametes coccinea BRFM310]|uniref:Ser-Thr-rich glycosyl-phosphatidyl-inositol-anchored membrane family-domain-containing protein n=1 Tax=Trametes coccinea (strain BRFM310) TaxID=1353009 RepID=A0A1Y2J2C2_TRAC3|nr:hypothetical protein PYCCODRAFT_1430803 [Trametes coccinea BRFM310]
MVMVLFRYLVLLWATVYAWSFRIPRATVSPTIISPSGLSQWTLGSVQTVEWVSDEDLTGLNGTVYMGYIQKDGNPFLWKDQPLAESFALADLAVNVRCPLNLPLGSHYVIALSINGDDSDISGVFSVNDFSTTGTADFSATPSALSTVGNVPSATITRTSVVGVIGTSGSSSSSDQSTQSTPTTSSPVSSATQSTSSGSARPTTTNEPNSASASLTANMGIVAMVMGAFWFLF